MKILFITNHVKGTDGWSRYARDLARVFVQQGHTVLCMVHETSGASLGASFYEQACLEAPIPYLGNPMLAWRTAQKVNPIIADFSPDIIHVIVEPYGAMLPFLHTGAAKIVVTAHSTYAFFPILVKGLVRTWISRIITRAFYRRADAVICVSEYTKKHLIRHMAAIGANGLVEGKISVLAGGVDLSQIKTPPQKTPISSEKTKKEILFVGAVKQRKGVGEAIDALAQVHTDFIFRIVGSYRENDPYVVAVRKKIDAHGLADKVVFTGVVSDLELAHFYDTADLFLMLSTNNGADFEGYGLVYIEANAHGVPAIGPHDSGVSDAIVDGKTGYLVNQYDAPAVAHTIDHVLRDHAISSADCIAWAQENAAEKKAAYMLDLYAKLRGTIV